MWLLQGALPGSAGSMAIAEARRAWMYYVEPSTLQVFFTANEGYSWQQMGSVPASLQNAVIPGLGVLYFNPSTLLVDVEGQGSGQGPYASKDGGTSFTSASSAGLGDFTQILSYSSGPTYATTPGYVGTYRSTDNAQTWQSLGVTGRPRWADRRGPESADHRLRPEDGLRV